VLVAFTIAAAMLAVAFRLLSTDLQSVARADTFTRAILLAQSRLDSVGIVEPLVPGISNGRFDEHFFWRVAVEKYAQDRTVDRDPPAALYRIRLTVSWQEGTAHRTVSLETLRLALAGRSTT